MAFNSSSHTTLHALGASQQVLDSPAGTQFTPNTGTPRKLSGTSVASFGSFASSYQDYNSRKLSNSSVSSGLTGSGTIAMPDEPNSPKYFTIDRATRTFSTADVNRISTVPLGPSPTGSCPTAATDARAGSRRKMSDPHEYGRVGRTHSGGGGTKMAPVLFEVDRVGGLRRLTSASLERYRPYLSK